MKVNKSIWFVRNNRKIKTFLIFLLLSAIFWFFTALSETYTYEATYHAVYTEIPNNLVYQNKKEQPITVQIETSGFRILWHRIKTKDIVIPVKDFKKKGSYSYYYLPNTKLVSLQKQFANEKLLHFVSDSLVLELGVLKSKKVPVVSQLNLSFKSGFKLREELQLVPDSVQVKGPAQYIDSIRFIKTKTEYLSDVQQQFSKILPLELPHIETGQLDFDVQEVQVIGKVAKFTEDKITIPIQILDLPNKAQVELDQNEVVLKYLVSFEDHKKVSLSSFEVSCRYVSDPLNQNKLRLYLSKKPDFITDYQLQPEYVGYRLDN